MDTTERKLKSVKINPRIVFHTVRFLIDFQSVVQALIYKIDLAKQTFLSQKRHFELRSIIPCTSTTIH